MADRLQKPVLVLNASYEPINICAARRALVLVLKGVASAEEESLNAIHSTRAAVRLPSVIRLIGIPAHPPPDARLLAQEHPDARPLHLSVLPSHDAIGRTDPGSCGSAIARRRIGLGKPGGLLPSVQQPQRQPHSGGSRNETGPSAAPFQPAHFAAPHAHAGQGRRTMAQIPLLLTSE